MGSSRTYSGRGVVFCCGNIIPAGVCRPDSGTSGVPDIKGGVLSNITGGGAGCGCRA